jgi:hypothetical protein
MEIILNDLKNQPIALATEPKAYQNFQNLAQLTSTILIIHNQSSQEI